jgi:CubicO group peptidase (beta-lactamase class C family)
MCKPVRNPRPLGQGRFKSSNFDEAIKSSPDVAHAYRKDDQEVAHEVPAYTRNQALGPAGAIVSNLGDMTQYLLMYLNQGRHGDQQIISAADIRSMTTPQMVIRSSELDPEIGYNHYGMGLFVTTYRGHKFVHHGGNLDGFSLLLSFLPDEKSGSVILLNMDSAACAKFLPTTLTTGYSGCLLWIGTKENWTATWRLRPRIKRRVIKIMCHGARIRISLMRSMSIWGSIPTRPMAR